MHNNRNVHKKKEAQFSVMTFCFHYHLACLAPGCQHGACRGKSADGSLCTLMGSTNLSSMHAEASCARRGIITLLLLMSATVTHAAVDVRDRHPTQEAARMQPRAPQDMLKLFSRRN
jgi:hypothetical protein